MKKKIVFNKVLAIMLLFNMVLGFWPKDVHAQEIPAESTTTTSSPTTETTATETTTTGTTTTETTTTTTTTTTDTSTTTTTTSQTPSETTQVPSETTPTPTETTQTSPSPTPVPVDQGSYTLRFQNDEQIGISVDSFSYKIQRRKVGTTTIIPTIVKEETVTGPISEHTIDLNTINPIYLTPQDELMISYTVEKAGYDTLTVTPEVLDPSGVKEVPLMVDITGNFEVTFKDSLLTLSPKRFLEIVTTVTRKDNGSVVREMPTRLEYTSQTKKVNFKTNYAKYILQPEVYTVEIAYTLNVDGYRTYTSAKHPLLVDSVENITLEKIPEYTLDINYLATQGTVVIKDQNGDTRTNGSLIREGTKLDITITAKARYAISSVTGADSGAIDSTGQTATYQVTMTGDKIIQVNFVKLYTVKIVYDQNGDVTTYINGSTDATAIPANGEVILIQDDILRLEANAKEFYRVVKVDIDGSIEEFADNQYSHGTPYTKELEANQNHVVNISFAPVLYTIAVDSANTSEFVDVLPSETEVDHGSDVTVNFEIAENYDLSEIIVSQDGNLLPFDATKFTLDTASNGRKATYIIENVTGNLLIAAKVLNVPNPSMADVTFTHGVEIEENGINYRIFGENTGVTISTERKGIEIYTSTGDVLGSNTINSVNITENTKIVKIILYTEQSGLGIVYDYPCEVFVDSGNPIRLTKDIDSPKVTFSPNRQNDNNFATDTTVTVTVKEDGVSAGIHKVQYSILKNGVVLDGFENIQVTVNNDERKLKTFDVVIPLEFPDGEAAEGIVIAVTATDRVNNSGTFETYEYYLSSDIPESTFEIVEDSTVSKVDNNYYVNGARKIKVTLIDKAFLFNRRAVGTIAESSVFKTLQVSVNGVWQAQSNLTWVREGDNYYTFLEFTADGTYQIKFEGYKNLADTLMPPEKVQFADPSIEKFVIDTSAPTGEITATPGGDTVSKLLETLSFGYFKNNKITVTAKETSATLTSPSHPIHYYKLNIDEKNSNAHLTLDVLRALDNNGEFKPLTNVVVDADERFVVYARLRDYAGNTTYIGTDGLVFDDSESGITLIPTTTANQHGFRNKDFEVKVNVSENIDLTTGEVKKAYSGIKSVDYTLRKDGKVIETARLFSFDKLKASKSELVSVFVTSEANRIKINSKTYNSDNVQLEVKVTDNAGNIQSRVLNFKINIDKPVLTVSYKDVQSTLAQSSPYYKKRTLELELVDRKSAFNSTEFLNSLNITAVDIGGKTITLDKAKMISEWTTDSKNTSIHRATLEFSVDGNYTVQSINYKNKADNSMSISEVRFKKDGKLLTEKTAIAALNPWKFTIDNIAPNGSLTLTPSFAEFAWKTLLRTINFGLFSKESQTLKSTTYDQISPYTIEYYKSVPAVDSTDNVLKYTTMTQEMLDQVQFTKLSTDSVLKGNQVLNVLNVPPNEQAVIYVRIRDYAGNYTYVSTNGFVVDKNASTISLTAPQPTGYIYNSDVKVNIAVDEGADYSGIKKVEYWVESYGKTTQSGTLFQFSSTSPKFEDLRKYWSGSITVDSTLNNSSNTIVNVRTTDNAGNVSTQKLALVIDITAPVISLSYNNNQSFGGNQFFSAPRILTISIYERMEHFDAAAATKGIAITAHNLAGAALSGAYTLGTWRSNPNTDKPDLSRHDLDIHFNTDANFTFTMAYTDLARNANNGINTGDNIHPYEFTVDMTDPSLSLTANSTEGQSGSWDDILSNLQFNFWSRNQISINASASDVTSPMHQILYYRHSAVGGRALSYQDLEQVGSWQVFKPFSIANDETSAIYIKAIDMAGNYSYAGSNGLIVDHQNPNVDSIAPTIAFTATQTSIFNRSVPIEISVTDPAANSSYAGLKEIRYEVYNLAQSATTATQSGTLFSFANGAASWSELVPTWSGSITVDSELNNSNSVKVVVYAVDNANNSSQKDYELKIDTTIPTIQVSYDNNSVLNKRYFKDIRTATIAITERNFDPNKVQVSINSSNGNQPVLSGWTQSTGGGNGDLSKWVARVPYEADGDYTFSIQFTDDAGNRADGVTYSNGSVAPEDFTIDRSRPVMGVTYDNNDAENQNYFKKGRTALISVTERNFNSEKFEMNLRATLDGEAITLPELSDWVTQGDKHTATINFSEDGYYTFELEYTDESGNIADTIGDHTFHIDKTKPALIISGVENHGAYKEDIQPKVSFSDLNLDIDTFSIKLVGANRGEIKNFGKLEKTEDGGFNFLFNGFPNREDIDDIYSVIASITDKAGNVHTEEVEFSINRFGSTYEMSEETKTLNGKYIREGLDIRVREVNPTKLTNISITLFKNGVPVYLEEGEDFQIIVTGGDGEWYQYEYIINKELFADDGVYSLSFYSEDEAGNVSENTLDTKNMEIKFGIDTVKPSINIKNLESGKTYASELYMVDFSAEDNLQLDKVIVYLNGEEFKVYTGEELIELIRSGGGFSFGIPGDRTDANSVRIVAYDSAGNMHEDVIENVFVTMSFWVRFVNNRPLFFGSLGSLAILSAGFFFFLLGKRKKEKEEDGAAEKQAI